MNQDIESYELLQSISKKSLSLLGKLKQQPDQLIELLNTLLDFSSDYQILSSELVQHPDKICQTYGAYYKDASELLEEQLNHWTSGNVMPCKDKRFSSDEWVNNPLFNLLSQHYLLACEHLNLLLENIELYDKQLAKRLKFFTRQYLDALSPDNFLHTNPQLIVETIEHQGKNLLRGLHNFLTDLETDSLRLIMKMTDMDAFQVGKNIATTQGQVIFRNEMMELIQYTPQTSKVRKIPLLIIPPWINKYYILDLSPHNSMVRWLVSQGITVFIISWVNPDATYAHKSFFDYLNEGPITAISVIQKQLRVKKINTMGFCIGGTLLASLLAYYQASAESPINSATFLATMIDFSDPGDISIFIDEKQLTKLEKHMNERGFLAGHVMAGAFNSLRASDLIWSFFINNYLRAKTHKPFDTLYWNADFTNMPAKMHSQYLRWMYLNNALVKPRNISLNNVPLDMSNIHTPTFFVGTQKDHIAPWKTTYLGYQLMRGPKRFILGGSGHIAGIITPPGNEKYGYYSNTRAPKNPEKWLSKADHHTGSWWPEWLNWLKKKSGILINAPNFNDLSLQPIIVAPGTYVYKKHNSESVHSIIEPASAKLHLTGQPPR